MLSGSSSSVASILSRPIDEWHLVRILNTFASIAEAIGYREFPIPRAEIQHVLNHLVRTIKEPSNDNYSRTTLLVLVSLLSVLLLASRSVISPLNLQTVGLEDCVFVAMTKIKLIRSNPYVLGLIFLLRLHTAFVHRQEQGLLVASLASSHGSDEIESAIDDNDLVSIVDLLSVIISRIADIKRTDFCSSPDDEHFIWLAFCAFHRYSSRLAETILGYIHIQDTWPGFDLDSISTEKVHCSSSFQGSLLSSSFLPNKNLLLMASMCTDTSGDLLNTEDIVFPAAPCRIDQNCSNAPSANDASYIMFLIEAYFLLFPDKSIYIADILCYTPYLPQSFISPIMGLLAPPVLTELSFDLQITNRNRCILGLIFINAVLAQTVSAYQYAITARCLLKQMKFSWIRAYIPLSAISSNVYFFGARSKVFQITILEDNEYINEVRLLLTSQPYVSESPRDRSQRNNVRRSKK